MPLSFVGCPVVAGHDVPLWAVVAANSQPGEFPVGLLLDDQNSIQSW
ncbi:hypothetical protein [Frankia casuarinae]|nr:hypothetical protein [Frankia casuarinae]